MPSGGSSTGQSNSPGTCRVVASARQDAPVGAVRPNAWRQAPGNRRASGGRGRAWLRRSSGSPSVSRPASPPAGDDGTPRAARHLEALRRHCRARLGVPRRRGRRGGGARRPQRGRQDHAVQLRARVAATRQRHDQPGRCADRHAADVPPQPPGDRPHLPAPGALHRHDAPRARAGRAPGPRWWAPDLARAARRGTAEITGAQGGRPAAVDHRALRCGRRARGGVGPRLRPSGRAGPRPGLPAPPAPARRALLRARRGGDGRPRRGDRPGPGRAGHGGAARRARPRDGGGSREPPGRLELRPQDRRRPAARGDGRSRGSPGVPGSGLPGAGTLSMASDPARSPAASGRPLLEVCRVDAAYGPYRALFEVSFEVAEGTAVALVGPNGAGKSTVARVVSGLVRPTAGSVRFAGRDVTRWPAWRIARLGLAHAPEGRSVFATLSVEENLVLTFHQAVGRRGQAEALSRAFGAFPRLAERRHQAAGTLSGGEQRMLTLARVFAVPQRLLVVDELSLGLDPVVLDEVFAALRSLRDTGTALLVIEQHVARALELAQWAVVLARGRVVHQGPAAEAGEVVAALLPAARAAPAAPGRAGDGRAGRGGDAGGRARTWWAPSLTERGRPRVSSAAGCPTCSRSCTGARRGRTPCSWPRATSRRRTRRSRRSSLRARCRSWPRCRRRPWRTATAPTRSGTPGGRGGSPGGRLPRPPRRQAARRAPRPWPGEGSGRLRPRRAWP